MEAKFVDPRLQRGAALVRAKASAIKLIAGSKYLVPSASHSGGYVVDAVERSCTCPDWADHGGPGRLHNCKHVYAVLIVSREIETPDGVVTIEQEVRVYPPRNWPVVNASLVDMPRIMPALISDLVTLIPMREGPRSRGRPQVETRDAVHGMLIKVFEERTARETVEAMERQKGKGLWGDRNLVHYNTLLREMQRDDTVTPVLQQLVGASAMPLRAIERNFAIDSTCFATSRTAPWNEVKWGPVEKSSKAHWLKVHGCVGTKWHAFTAVQVTENTVGDSPMLPVLVQRTIEAGFIPRKVTADAAYLSAVNINAIESVGADAYIDFKENTTGSSSPVLGRLFYKYMADREAYMREYHNRSNVESAFGAMKNRFGHYLRAKRPLSQYNELLCKVVCHNLAMIVLATHELGIEANFGDMLVLPERAA
jgi:hypothetical protein